MTKKLAVAVGALAVTAAAVAALWKWPGEGDGAQYAVRTARVDRGPVAAQIRVTGVVTAEHEIAVAAAVPARVLGVPALPGVSVAPGAVLVRLDTSTAEAELAASEAAVQEVSTEIARREKQLEGLRLDERAGAEAHSTVVDAEAQLATQRARHAKAAADARLATVRLQQFAVRAPTGGLITAVDVKPGEFTQPGKPLVRLIDPRRLSVLAKLEPADAPLVRVGMQAQVAVEGSGERPNTERVLRIEPSISRDGGSEYLGVWLSLGVTPRAVLPNQQVDVRFAIGSGEPAVRVPVEAVVTRTGRDAVWILREGRLALRPIVTRTFGERYVEVVSGLQQGETVAIPDGSVAWKEGERAVGAAPAAAR